MMNVLDHFRAFAEWICGAGISCGWFVSITCIMSFCSILLGLALIISTFFDVD